MRGSQALAALDDPREVRFVERYVETNNATQSAIVAGYSSKSAHTIAHRLLKRSKIKQAIAVKNATMMDKLGFDGPRIVRRFATIASENPAFKGGDVLRALENLAQIANLYPAQRTELTGADGGPIATANLNVNKIDIEALEPDQRAQLRATLLMLKGSSEPK